MDTLKNKPHFGQKTRFFVLHKESPMILINVVSKIGLTVRLDDKKMV